MSDADKLLKTIFINALKDTSHPHHGLANRFMDEAIHQSWSWSCDVTDEMAKDPIINKISPERSRVQALDEHVAAIATNYGVDIHRTSSPTIDGFVSAIIKHGIDSTEAEYFEYPVYFLDGYTPRHLQTETKDEVTP